MSEMICRRNAIRITEMFLVVFALFEGALAVDHKVLCSPKMMTVTVAAPPENVYLDRLKDYPGCATVMDERGLSVINLSLEDIYTCGTTRVADKVTGRKVFYHRVVVETNGLDKETFLIKCELPGNEIYALDRIRRQLPGLPDNFTEAEVFIEKTIIKSAPTPILGIAVRQNGRAVDTEVNVQPGTPLQMDVYLDRESSATYGLLVRNINVTDNTPQQEEMIVLNGCSIDPYLFSNFETDNGGDHLTARFRAFKFPETSYVLFIGSVDVCLQKCKGIRCSNGQVGFGKKRRDINGHNDVLDPNKIFEVTMTTIVKIASKQEPLKGSASLIFPRPDSPDMDYGRNLNVQQDLFVSQSGLRSHHCSLLMSAAAVVVATIHRWMR